MIKQTFPHTRIHALSHDGRGIASINNKTTFVQGALIDEMITYEITHKKSRYNEAKLIEILSPSPKRAIPSCEHFGVCGGCNLQHMDMDLQSSLKQQTLLDHLKHFGTVEPLALLPPLSAHTLGYRRKARLGVKFVFKKNKLLVGFREKNSRYLADLNQCVVLHPKIGTRLLDLANLISKLRHFDQIPQIEVAMGDTDAALVFRHLVALDDQDKKLLAAFGEDFHFHIYLQPNPPAPLEKLWPNDDNHWIAYTLPDHQLTMQFHPLDFTQINLEMNRLMIKQALTLLEIKKEETMLDLFCGMGNFTLPIARYAQSVTGIEGSQDMILRARKNAKQNGISHVAFYVQDLVSPANEKAPWLKPYDKILLDPPRAGAKELIPYFRQWQAKRIVYISCNPATLARDALELVHQLGYTLKYAGILNMFPHTAHIEAMAVFDKNK